MICFYFFLVLWIFSICQIIYKYFWLCYRKKIICSVLVFPWCKSLWWNAHISRSQTSLSKAILLTKTRFFSPQLSVLSLFVFGCGLGWSVGYVSVYMATFIEFLQFLSPVHWPHWRKRPVFFFFINSSLFECNLFLFVIVTVLS